jgi:enoyl-CoA hydratase/carnithine racemase
MESLVRFEVPTYGLAHVVFDRPQARNALTWEAMRQFAEAVSAAQTIPDLRCLIVTGRPEAFCAGGDVFELDAYPTRVDGARLSALMAEALDRLEALPIPTIAAIEGPALGGGAEIAVACDIRIMAEAATFGMMHVRLGITPAWGGGQRLLRLTGYARALEWLTIGRVLTAQEAFSYGLANRVVGKGHAMAEASAVAQSIIANDPASVQAAKRLLRAGILLAPESAAKAERAEFPDLWAAPAHLAASAAFLASRNHRNVSR